MLQGDYPYYSDVQSITDAADVIIVGEVIESGNVQDLMVDHTPGKEDKEPIKYTLSTVRVTEVISGNVQVGDIITVKQIGDHQNFPEATLNEIDGYLKDGQEELMFLAEYFGFDLFCISGVCSVICTRCFRSNDPIVSKFTVCIINCFLENSIKCVYQVFPGFNRRIIHIELDIKRRFLRVGRPDLDDEG